MTHPIGWQEVKLGDITKILAGGTPSTKNQEYWNGNILWLTSGELNNKKIYTTKTKITEKGLENSNTRIIPIESILIGLAGQGKTRGTVAINYVELCTNQSVASILPNEYFIQKYLYYQLDMRYKELRSLSYGDGGRGGLNLKILNNLIVKVPPLDEQKRIAEILSICDDYIENLSKLIEKKEQYKKGVMQKVLSGEVRFKGFKYEWQTVRLGDISEYFRGLSYKKDNVVDVGLLVLRSNNIQNYNIDFSNEELQFVNKDCSNDILLRKYDIVICMANGSKKLVGKSAEYKGNYGDKITIGAFCGLLRSQNTLLKYILQTKIYRDYIDIILAGTNINNLRSTELLDFTFLIPTSVEEQKKIASLLNAIDEDIDNLKKELELRKQQKKGLMQKLLTGEVRV